VFTSVFEASIYSLDVSLKGPKMTNSWRKN